MRTPAPTGNPVGNDDELQRLLHFSERVGSDPLLTQASTGNSSAKLGDVLWMKASGKWMANATRENIFLPLNLTQVVTECLRQDVDPAERYPSASVETAMHATLPHRVVLHVHSVNTIAWSVRSDALDHLRQRLEGLRWQWLPYTASGLPLSRAIQQALSACSDTDLFVLGNHGLVIGGEKVRHLEDLLDEVERRLAIPPRHTRPADYAALRELCRDSGWELPHDREVHALGTDETARAILAEGVLYPCQAIFADMGKGEMFRAVPRPVAGDEWQKRYRDRPFLIIEDRGVIVSKSAKPGALAMISGLAQVVTRLTESSPIRYLTEAEVAGISGAVAYRYRELADAGQSVWRR